MKIWKIIGEIDSRKTNIKTEIDFCRIALLVTLISSKIKDVNKGCYGMDFLATLFLYLLLQVKTFSIKLYYPPKGNYYCPPFVIFPCEKSFRYL